MRNGQIIQTSQNNKGLRNKLIKLNRILGTNFIGLDIIYVFHDDDFNYFHMGFVQYINSHYEFILSDEPSYCHRDCFKRILKTNKKSYYTKIAKLLTDIQFDTNDSDFDSFFAPILQQYAHNKKIAFIDTWKGMKTITEPEYHI
jgi:hypothetical protein